MDEERGAPLLLALFVEEPADDDDEEDDSKSFVLGERDRNVNGVAFGLRFGMTISLLVEEDEPS